METNMENYNTTSNETTTRKCHEINDQSRDCLKNENDSSILSSISIIDASGQAVLSRNANRLPCLIKLNNDTIVDRRRRHHSMPVDFHEPTVEEGVDKAAAASQLHSRGSPKAVSMIAELPASMETSEECNTPVIATNHRTEATTTTTSSTPAAAVTTTNIDSNDKNQVTISSQQVAIANQHESALAPASMGDSLIELIINLKNENQNLAHALDVNNEYVRRRLSEMRDFQAETNFLKQRFELEKQDMANKINKLMQQNQMLNDRVRILDHEKSVLLSTQTQTSKSEQQVSRVTSEQQHNRLYPDLSRPDTLQLNDNINQLALQCNQWPPRISPMDVSNDTAEYTVITPQSPTGTTAAAAAAATTTTFYSDSDSDHRRRQNQSVTRTTCDNSSSNASKVDDPMQQCDRLEQKLNDIGKRDYEICLLQQQLNIYRQDFRLERMAKLEAQRQIEQLKNDIDRLCFERSTQAVHDSVPQHPTTSTKDREHSFSSDKTNSDETDSDSSSDSGADVVVGDNGKAQAARDAARKGAHHRRHKGSRNHSGRHGRHHRHSRELEQSPPALDEHQPTVVVGPTETLGRRASRSAMKAAAKAAKYASSHYSKRHQRKYNRHQASSSMFEQASNDAAAAGQQWAHSQSQQRSGSIKNEVVNDLITTANKAMITGYKMASTHVNLALERLGQFEPNQGNNSK